MIDDIGRAAWLSRSDPAKHPPRRALEIALADIDSGKLDPLHIIIVHTSEVQDKEGGYRTGYYQAGKLGHFAQLGVMHTATNILGEN